MIKNNKIKTLMRTFLETPLKIFVLLFLSFLITIIKRLKDAN